MPTTNGISDESMAVQQAHSAAQTALAEYETLEADAQALAEEVNSTIAHLLSLGEPLRLALQHRYSAYHRAVSAERTRARLSGVESNESAIRIRAWRPIIRVPAGVVSNIEVNAEYSVSVVPLEVDTSLLVNKSPAFDYLPTGEPVPLRRGKG